MSYTKAQFEQCRRKTLHAVTRLQTLLEEFPGGLADRDNYIPELDNIAEAVERADVNPHDPHYEEEEDDHNPKE